LTVRPLYANAAQDELPGPGTGHAGLWYDKFCDRWSSNWSLSQEAGAGGGKARGDASRSCENRDDGKGRGSPKDTWIRTVSDRPVGFPNLLAESVRRARALVAAAGGRAAVFRTEGRFVTGIGRHHPVENGFAWHPTLGVPYLPGSSVKGLLRAWARAEGNEAEAERIFGASSGSPRVGQVVLLDAVPVRPVKLEVDVMTPHFANWTEDAPPGDWRSPVPVPFLTTGAGQAFLFAVLPRTEEAAEHLDRVMEWLRDALAFAGAGAKTAVGYGRFAPAPDEDRNLDNEEAKRRAEREKARLAETPEGRWQLALEKKQEDDVYRDARAALESADDGDRIALARALAALGYLDAWCKGQPRGKGRPPAGTLKLKDLGKKYRALAAD
jgi:CRISPR-associated protein Cmr6